MRYPILLFLVIVLLLTWHYWGPYFMKEKLSSEVQALLAVPSEFNKKIGEAGWHVHSTEIKDISATDIHCYQSSFTDVDFNGCKFDHSVLKATVFRNVNFLNSEFSTALFISCQFINCKFSSAIFDEATVQSNTFDKCEVIDCSFRKSNFSEVTFSNTILEKTHFESSTHQSAKFVQCRLTSCPFSYAKLINVDFAGTYMARSGFMEAEINHGNFIIEGEKINFYYATVQHLSIESTKGIDDLNCSGMKGQHVTIANFNDSRFLGLAFSVIDSLRIDNCKFKGVTCSYANLSNSILCNSFFDITIFNNSQFTNVRFLKMSFDRSFVFDDVTYTGLDFQEIKKADKFSGSFKNTAFEQKQPF
jgi:fluoroquinolone resistance protein